MCAQSFSGINFTKYDYNQFILELNKIKYLRAKTGKWAWAGYSKLAKITYAWGTKTLKNCKFQSWIYIISHFIAETLTTRWLSLYSYIASGHWSNDKLIHIDLCIYVSYLMKRSLRTQTHLAIGSQINRLSLYIIKWGLPQYVPSAYTSIKLKMLKESSHFAVHERCRKISTLCWKV